MRDAANVVERHPVGTADGTLADDEAVDEYVLATGNHAAVVAVGRTGDTSSEDAHVVGILDEKGAGEVAAAFHIDGRVGGNEHFASVSCLATDGPTPDPSRKGGEKLLKSL